MSKHSMWHFFYLRGLPGKDSHSLLRLQESVSRNPWFIYFPRSLFQTICICWAARDTSLLFKILIVWFGLWGFSASIVHGPLFHDIPPSRYHYLDDSVNVITIKVAESDVRFPIDVYGTVLARDGYDHRCIYVFKRGRADPQRITRKVCIPWIPPCRRLRLSVSRSLLITTVWSHKPLLFSPSGKKGREEWSYPI